MIDAHLLTSGVIFGLSMGSIFFLMSVGLSLCFGLMRVISLDQLLYYSIGAYITYSISLAIGDLWLGVLSGVVVGGIASLAMERLVYLRIYERDITFSMITSFGILIGGVGVIKYFWGLVPRPVPVPIAAQIDILGTEVPVYRLVVVVIALLVYAGIWLFLNRTIIGKAIRAGIEDVEHVEGLGINVYRLFTITFIIAGALSGLAGGLHAHLGIDHDQGGMQCAGQPGQRSGDDEGDGEQPVHVDAEALDVFHVLDAGPDRLAGDGPVQEQPDAGVNH